MTLVTNHWSPRLLTAPSRSPFAVANRSPPVVEWRQHPGVPNARTFRCRFAGGCADVCTWGFRSTTIDCRVTGTACGQSGRESLGKHAIGRLSLSRNEVVREHKTRHIHDPKRGAGKRIPASLWEGLPVSLEPARSHGERACPARSHRVPRRLFFACIVIPSEARNLLLIVSGLTTEAWEWP